MSSQLIIFSRNRSLSILAILAAVFGSFVAISVLWSPGASHGYRVEPALLLSFEDVTPTSVACNATAVVDREGALLAAITVSHCSDHFRAVAVGGDDLCDPAQWQVVNLESWRSIGTDLSVAFDETGDGQVRAPVFVTEIVVDPSLDAEVVGFGREGGSGSLICDRQKIDNRTLSRDECPLDVVEVNDLCLRGGVFCAGWSGSGVYVDKTFSGVLVGGNTCRIGPEGAVLARAVVVSEPDESAAYSASPL